MRNKYIVFITLFVCFGCSERHKINKIALALGKCEERWQYFKLDTPIKGVVLLHTKGYCAFAHLHANTIIITGKSDTIRINGPCYTENVSVLDSVVVQPYESDAVIGAVGDLRYDCTIRKTCYGIISKFK